MGEGGGRGGGSSSGSGSEGSGNVRSTPTGTHGFIGARGPGYTGGAAGFSDIGSSSGGRGEGEGWGYSNDEKIKPYVFEEKPKVNHAEVSRRNKNCAVATVIYKGDENHPNVERLRQFRDNRLAMQPWGRKFIHFYYNGFCFKAAIILRRYFPWILPVFRKLFDWIIPTLPIRLVAESKEIPMDIFQLDFEKFCLECADFLWKNAKAREAKCLCVGLSGGIDSAMIAQMCKLSGIDVVAITVSGKRFIRNQDVLDAREVAQHLGIRHIIVDMSELFKKALLYNLPNPEHIIMGLRNTVVKEIAEDHGGFLIGTSIKTELYSGLFSPNTMAGATQPLEILFKTQVYALANYLGLPECVLGKPSHSGIEGDVDDSFFGLGYALFDWVCCLLEKELPAERIAMETGVEKCVINAIKDRKRISDELLRFPEFDFKPR